VLARCGLRRDERRRVHPRRLEHAPGDEVTIKIIRDDALRELKAQLGSK
jgi:S1-C subfamily serine protease